MRYATTTEAEAVAPETTRLHQLRDVASTVHAPVPGTILDSKTPLSFGPAAGPQLAVLAAAALGTAGRLAGDSVTASRAESLANTRTYDGIMGQAIVAEAALDCFLNYKLPDKDLKAVENFMAPIVAGLKPFVTRVAPKVLQGMMEPSLRLLLSSVTGESQLTHKEIRVRRSMDAEKDTGLGRKLSDKESAFLTELMAEVDDKTAESFLSTISSVGDVIGGAFKKAGPVLKDVAGIGLSLLGGTESTVQEDSTLTPLADRAIMAEACLQAFVEQPEGLNLKSFGFFKKMADRVKDLGPKLVKAAPVVVKYVGPVVADMLRQTQDQHN